jgi:hypothetical protein
VVGVGLLGVAGEEVSWGQRLLNFETPEAIAQQNRQGEINLHNSEVFWPYVYTAYLIIGLFGMLMWIFDWLGGELLSLKKKQKIWKKILIPGGHLFVLFGVIVLYVWLRNHHGPWKYQAWEEFAELLLVSGIMIHLVEVFLSFPKKS